VLPVVAQEKCVAVSGFLFSDAIAEGAANKRRSTPSHIAINRFVRKCRAPHVRERRIHGKGEIKLGID